MAGGIFHPHLNNDDVVFKKEVTIEKVKKKKLQASQQSSPQGKAPEDWGRGWGCVERENRQWVKEKKEKDD